MPAKTSPTADATTARSDAARMAAKRAAERDLKISRVADPIRRRDCLANTYEFLRQYFGGIFSQAFTPTRRQMIEGIEHAGRYGGDQAVAGPRGDGKTRSALFVGFKLQLAGQVRFPVIISKSGDRADRELKNLKDAIRASAKLRADFPEVVEPILALGGWASKARQQTAFGMSTEIEWGAQCIILPTISTKVLRENGWNDELESAALGQIMASLGIEGPIRGYSVRNERPDMAIIDDIDDRESARSELQTTTRESIIEEDVGGLAGPDKTIARVMLCTLINHTCIAATYTDRQKKPSWRGQRHKLLETLPERMDLWEEYIALRQGRDESDPDARKAHEHYVAKRELMDAGAVVTNPNRFDARPLADGEPGQLSALQACFDLIADRGWEHFNTEYNNDPPVEEGPIESGISATKIQGRLSGYPRRVVPNDAIMLTAGVDAKKIGLHWVVRAWLGNATNYVIDYGFHETHGTTYGSDEGVEHAVRRAMLELSEQWRQDPYCKQSGDEMPVDCALWDAGWMSPAVYDACERMGMGNWPAKGHGKSHGCATPNFSPISRASRDRKPGDGWFLSRVKRGLWLVNADTDRWKSFEHARWMTPEGKPGAAYLFGEIGDEERKHLAHRLPRDAKDHFSFAKHLTAEIETEDVIRGRVVRIWKVKAGRVQNHYGDACYLSCVAAAMQGVRLLGDSHVAVAPEVAQGGWFAAQDRKGSR